ncbi:calcium-binding protein [Rhizorhabdus wittichii]|uniref:calcium-binding protein n=1 Tax=Rhizorhabdus wittichii TaxID=160791 RepID=UPI000318002B|nr:calcium-binding protein [Rhizorhabdus wittichii]
MKTTNLAAAISPLALMGYAMTPAERAKGRYMRAPDGHDDNGGGSDTQSGGGGDDTMQGGGGSDTMPGGGGSDTMAGGGTDDTKDWRAEMSGGDDKLLGYLARVASPKALAERVKKHDDDLKAGRYIKPIDENSTDEEKAAWNKLLGVPDKHEAYSENLPNGLVIGEDDKPAVDSFFKAAHAAGLSTGQAHAALQAYYDIVDEQMGAQVEANDTAKQAAEDVLRAEWGADYRRNLNVLKSFTDALPEGVGELLMGAVGSDGVQLMNNPGLVKWMMGVALEQNPLATVVPGAGANQASAIDEELASIKKVMTENRPAYDKDEKMQARYRELLAAREKLPK